MRVDGLLLFVMVLLFSVAYMWRTFSNFLHNKKAGNPPFHTLHDPCTDIILLAIVVLTVLIWVLYPLIQILRGKAARKEAPPLDFESEQDLPAGLWPTTLHARSNISGDDHEEKEEELGADSTSSTAAVAASGWRANWKMGATGPLAAAITISDSEELVSGNDNSRVAAGPSTLLRLPGVPEIVGRGDIFSEILHHLSDDRVGMVLMCGPPGVGKTTLLRLVHQEYYRRRCTTHHFDVVAWVTVSRWSTAMEVQRQIGERLGLSLFAEGPDFLQERQASTLRKLLSGRPFLLLVDELVLPEGAPEPAERFLEKVGVPRPAGPAGNNKSKIIIACTAARCAGIDDDEGMPGSVLRVVRVAGLDARDSRRLFLEKAGFGGQWPPAILLHLADKYCRGLPLALIVLGEQIGRLNLPTGLEEEDSLLEATKMISRSLGADDGGVVLSDQEVLRQILDRGCRDLLGASERSWLMYCSLFPENYEIRVEELEEYCIGERHSTAVLRSILQKLQSLGLLERGGPANEAWVKLHTAVREVAWDVADSKSLVYAGQGLKAWPHPSTKATISLQQATRISLMYNHIEVLPAAGTDGSHREILPAAGTDSNEPVCFPQLLTLMLNNNPLTGIPERFFPGMPKLRVLDLSWTRIEELPGTIGSLRGLRYLKLSHTRIRSLPEELQSLRKLSQLYLNHTGHLRSIPRAAISNLSALRRLGLLGTAHRWSEEADDVDEYTRTEANLGDLDRLRKLEEVSLTIRSVSSMKRLRGLEKLRGATRSLLLDRIQGLRNRSNKENDDLSRDFANMRHRLLELRINEAPELEKLAFPVSWGLEALSLDHLPRASISFGGFPCLRRLRVVGCHRIEHLEGAHQLVSLESLELRICHRLRVFSGGGGDESALTSTVGDEEEPSSSSQFRYLEKMVLWGLPSLEGISAGSRPLRLPSLGYVEVYHCPKLKKLPFRRYDDADTMLEIHGSRDWWDGLEWDDQDMKSALEPRFSDPRRDWKT